METLKFKTSIMCSGCLSKVTPPLNNSEGIINWNVDLEHPNKILTIHTEKLKADAIIRTLKEVGYEAELI